MSFMRGAATIPNLNGLAFKTLTGTTGAQGTSTNILHGLVLADIIGWSSYITSLSGRIVTQGDLVLPNFEFNTFLNATVASVALDATNSSSLVSRPINVFIWHKP